MINTLSLDLETYSTEDLSKSGVYRYAESPSFEILLLGVSLNAGEVHVYDLRGGEKIPEEIISALVDDSVLKWAFNASFERVCLSVWLRRFYPERFKSYGRGDDSVGRYLNPVSWRCSMVWSAYMGLPLSLAGAGAVLGLEEQKLKEGKDLIKYFCVPCAPTKSNGGRTRNLPEHDMEKWNLFKAYNKRDVEVEMSIQEKLKNYPVPDFVWDEYHLDQMINDRGIALDMTLVENAINFDEISRSIIIEKLQHITGVDNPNSVSQMKTWLSDQGVETETLGKKTVQSLIPETHGEIKDALILRLQCAKSSIKKYQAMKNTVCEDNRARGMFQFYGANRTGRWCLTGDHEVLTKDGWTRLDEWNGGPIACWNFRTEGVSFLSSNALFFNYTGAMYTYRDDYIDQCSTPEHKMRVKRNPGAAWENMTVEDMAKITPLIPLGGVKEYKNLSDSEYLRVLVMTEAVGSYKDDGTLTYHFKNAEEASRCKNLLESAQLFFYKKTHPEGRTVFEITSSCLPLWLREFNEKTYGTWLFDENPDVFFDELKFWNKEYSTTNRRNADIIQAFAHMSGRAAVLSERRTKNPCFSLDISEGRVEAHKIEVKPEITDFSGKVYCAETPTGYFLVRRNGKVWVTGNSGRHVQLQNLRQNHIKDLESTRELVRTGNYEAMNLLYDDIPDTLSQLVRTAFIPRRGYKFIVSDFSAIEARVLAWLAGEQWVLDVFSTGGDIYCETASRMFGVPVEKHGVNADLRQKGKQATLSCGYGGGVGALKAMGAIEAGMKEEELGPLVDAWRKANPNIVSLWWAVDKAVKDAVKGKTTTHTHGLEFKCQSGMLFIVLPSGRQLSYVKPRMGENKFGGESVTYEGIGSTKKWERIESYGPKFVENVVQAISRDILMYAMKTLSNYFICAHVHDELIIECEKDTSLTAICSLMGETPPWAGGLILRADGYECDFYKKD